MSTSIETATATEWAWKTEVMRAMAVSVCRLALERGLNGQFSALDLPMHGASAHGGSGIAGSVFRQLKHMGIVARVGTWVDGAWYPRTVFNAGGNPIGVYRLASPAHAHALLERHAPSYSVSQLSLAL